MLARLSACWVNLEFVDGLTRKCKVSIVPMIIQLFQKQGMKFCFGLLLLIYTLLGQLYG